MRVERIATIARREYLAGVRTKGFWISTLLLPVLMAAMLFVPSLLMMKTRTTLRLAVVDETGKVGTRLAAELDAAEQAPLDASPASRDRRAESSRFAVEVRPTGANTAGERAELDREVLEGKIDAWIWIAPEALTGAKVPYHAESVSNFVTQRMLEDALTRAVSTERLGAAGIDAAKVNELTAEVDLETVRVSAEGAKREAGMTGFALAMTLFFLLYTVTLIYGQQVMNGVLEEKTSRIVEVVLATARPVELLAGKLLGIGAVGLSQLGIWMGAALLLSAPGLLASFTSLPAGVSLPAVTPALAFHFLACFLLGFLLFAALYAAVGSASNDIKEAQQLAGFVVVFVVAPVLFMFTVINDPDSTLAVALSLFPPFMPLLMMLRIAVKMPPLWQVAAGYLLTSAFVAFLIWGCARIYRVGLLMHGKRPTLPELWRWLRRA
ncbi:MAG: ABC transporter permease [Acidobacteriota bacterium]